MEVRLVRGGQAFLEDLAVALRGAAERARRDARRAMERAHEVREIAEADAERDLSDRARVVGQKASRTAQPRAHQVLVRRHAEHLAEQAQEVERAEPRLARGALEVDLLVRVRVDPERRVDRAAPIALRRGARTE